MKTLFKTPEILIIKNTKAASSYHEATGDSRKTAAVQNPVVVMKRYEMKYLISSEQERFIREKLKGRMEPDEFGLTTVSSLYYDTPDRRLINNSLEKTGYKEKIRLRSYGPATDSSPVFLELKRKAYGIVYKRRTQTTVPAADRFINGGGGICSKSQINRELNYFRDFYGNLSPSCLIITERTAFFEPNGTLRITVDNDPRYRAADLDLRKPADGIPLLQKGWSILEIKVQEAVPLWLCEILSAGRIYKTNFSKYGEAYKRQMQFAYNGGTLNV